jgi:hypothetical protein
MVGSEAESRQWYAGTVEIYCARDQSISAVNSGFVLAPKATTCGSLLQLRFQAFGEIHPEPETGPLKSRFRFCLRFAYQLLHGPVGEYRGAPVTRPSGIRGLRVACTFHHFAL